MTSAERRPPARMTVDEFLDWDPGDGSWWELVDGRPRMMTHPMPPHALLAARLTRRLGEALERSRPDCEPMVAPGVRPRPGVDRVFVPDLAVDCGPRARGERLVASPLVIVEILSPTTREHDRMVKLPDYRRIAAVREVVLVDSERPFVEVHRRLDAERWLTLLAVGPEAVLELETAGLSLPLADLYRGLVSEDEDPAAEGG
jgi:Uma2 family endonuclease